MGAWLIQISLCMGWHHKPHRMKLPALLEDETFQKISGIELPWKLDEDGDPVLDRKAVTKMTDAKIADMLEDRLAHLELERLAEDLPLIRNVDVLGDRLGLNKADKAVLSFAVALSAFSSFRAVISGRYEEVNNQQLARIVAAVSGVAESKISDALRDDAPLRATGIIRLDSSSTDLETKIDLMDRLAPTLLIPDADEDTMIERFLRPAGPGTLDLEAFPHLASDIATLLPYLRNSLSQGEAGINVLFYGASGTGKTELAKALAQELGMGLFEISYANEDGDPIKGQKRLRAYNLCQRIMAKMPNALLMFDEIEDVFPSDMSGLLKALFGDEEDGAASGNGKAWINRTLERNPMPAIWITNSARFDPAYLRRFDYSIRFSIPPQSVRMAIARRHFGEFKPTEQWLERIAANEHASPAQLERAARVARLVAADGQQPAVTIVEQSLDRSATLLQQKRTPARNQVRTGYDLGFVNVDIDLNRVIEGLKQRPRGTFCFYGPAGTGKSELGRHLADAIDKPFLMRRASDLLSMWVGEAEKNIAGMFAEARQRDTVLILDEADSFLADRRDARANWEVTQVNELLTQMEAFEGIFICTTNLMQKLDQASLRRFAFKVKFDYLNADQREAMFRRELGLLGGDVDGAADWLTQVRRLEHLTPGDFSVAVRQFELWGTTPSPAELFEQLRKECIAKGAPARGMGFAV
jgi:SpoVK/Ycf46/Vps4 family AAA+-type ATPase